MRTLIVHNGSSGFGSDAIFEFMRILLDAGDECSMRMIGNGMEPAQALADAERFDLVVASGGDGTVANILYELRFRNVPTCVFPSGTANLLFSNIGNAPEPAAIATACLRRHLTNLDLGEMRWIDDDGNAHQRGFSIMAGSGYDADIMRQAVAGKQAYGEAAYFYAAAANLEPTIAHFTIEVDGVVYERDGISCIMANTAMMQGDIQIVPDCSMSDNLLDVVVLESENAAQLLQPLFRGIFDKEGKTLGRPFIESFKGRHIKVTSSEPIPLQFDGEVTPSTIHSYEARSLGGAARIIVDRHSPYYCG